MENQRTFKSSTITSTIRKVFYFSKPEIVLIVAVFLLYLGWACTMPISMAPDEYMRFDVPLFIQQFGALPSGDDPLIRNPIWGISYAFTPYGSSLLAALFMGIASLFTSDLSIWLLAARMVSVLCGTGTLIVCLKIGDRIFKSSLTKYLFAAIIAFLPQFVFLSSYFNSDTFAIFSTALIFYYWLKGSDDGWKKSSCIGLGVSLGLCILSYYNAYGFVLMSLVFFFGSNLLDLKDRGIHASQIIPLAKKTLWVIFPVALIAGWFFILNAIQYNGDFLGMSASREASELFAQESLRPSNRITYASQGLPIINIIFDNDFLWAKSSIKSFIGMFGYMDIPMPQYLYYAYYLFFAACLAVCLPFIIKMIKGKGIHSLLAICLFFCIIIPIVLSVYNSYSSDWQAQGRYVMPLLVPLAFFFAGGTETVAGKLKSKNKQCIFQYSFLAVYLLLFVFAFFTTILPYCFDDFLCIYSKELLNLILPSCSPIVSLVNPW